MSSEMFVGDIILLKIDLDSRIFKQSLSNSLAYLKLIFQTFFLIMHFMGSTVSNFIKKIM